MRKVRVMEGRISAGILPFVSIPLGGATLEPPAPFFFCVCLYFIYKFTTFGCQAFKVSVLARWCSANDDVIN